ncbi:MAG: aminopeptidase N, partial [Bdellovibrionota bacterium]
VIANTREREVTALEGGRKSWAFPPSPVFSTYLFAMHAGPYSVWKAAAEGIPTRLFARRSMAQYVDHQEWLNITKRGLDHYGLYFGLIYPFGKYDQILVPDYNHGAMENVGAVTFSEKYIFRSKPTTDKRRHRAEVILHEMAHMWFGDLVTMRWWNGLWLNESFATFMAGLATEKATDFQGTWQSFFGEKQWAYWEDQLVTTHPIEVPVPDTDHAEANFDGITYGKGAASLKQLHFYLGDDDFREGLQRYFERFAFRNTTIHDFIQMLSEASSKDLSHWQKSWLQSPGVNTIRAKWTCGPDERGKSEIKQFSLAQLPASTPGSAPELRPHKTQVALFYFAKGAPKNRAALRSDKTMDVTYTDSETQVAEAAEEACPDFVFPNYHDFDYVKVELDEGSLGVLRKHLSQIEDAFTRQMIWHTLWEMVVDAKLRDQDYIDMVLKHGLAEKDTQILENLIENLTDPALKYLAPELSQEYSDKLENAFRTRLMSAPAGSDLQLVWFKAYADVAYTKRAGKFLERLLGGKITLKGFDLEQDRRWTIIQALSRIGLQNAPELIAMERHTDATDIGEKAAIKAEALAPDLAAKQKWFDRFVGVTGAEKMPIAKLREAMRGFHVVGREDLSKAFADRFFEELTKLAEKTGIEDKDLAHRFGEWVWPPTCEDSNVQRATVLLKAHPGWSAAVIKDLLVHRQEEERCIQARKKSAEGIERDEPEQTPIVPVAAPVAAPVAPIASPAAPEQTPEPSPTVEFEVQPDNGPNPSPRTGGSPLPAGR